MQLHVESCIEACCSTPPVENWQAVAGFFGGFGLCLSRRSNSSYTCSISARSGEIAGHGNTSTCCCRWVLTTFATLGRALSCWNIIPGPLAFRKGTACWPSISSQEQIAVLFPWPSQFFLYESCHPKLWLNILSFDPSEKHMHQQNTHHTPIFVCLPEDRTLIISIEYPSPLTVRPHNMLSCPLHASSSLLRFKNWSVRFCVYFS